MAPPPQPSRQRKQQPGQQPQHPSLYQYQPMLPASYAQPQLQQQRWPQQVAQQPHQQPSQLPFIYPVVQQPYPWFQPPLPVPTTTVSRQATLPGTPVASGGPSTTLMTMPRQQQPQRQPVHPHDVLFTAGRGRNSRAVTEHLGNMRYRGWIQDQLKVVGEIETARNGKSSAAPSGIVITRKARAQYVMGQVRGQRPPGRFLVEKKDDNDHDTTKTTTPPLAAVAATIYVHDNRYWVEVTSETTILKRTLHAMTVEKGRQQRKQKDNNSKSNTTTTTSATATKKTTRKGVTVTSTPIPATTPKKTTPSGSKRKDQEVQRQKSDDGQQQPRSQKRQKTAPSSHGSSSAKTADCDYNSKPDNSNNSPNYEEEGGWLMKMRRAVTSWWSS